MTTPRFNHNFISPAYGFHGFCNSWGLVTNVRSYLPVGVRGVNTLPTIQRSLCVFSSPKFKVGGSHEKKWKWRAAERRPTDQAHLSRRDRAEVFGAQATFRIVKSGNLAVPLQDSQSPPHTHTQIFPQRMVCAQLIGKFCSSAGKPQTPSPQFVINNWSIISHRGGDYCVQHPADKQA